MQSTRYWEATEGHILTPVTGTGMQSAVKRQEMEGNNAAQLEKGSMKSHSASTNNSAPTRVRTGKPWWEGRGSILISFQSRTEYAGCLPLGRYLPGLRAVVAGESVVQRRGWRGARRRDHHPGLRLRLPLPEPPPLHWPDQSSPPSG